MSWDRRGRPPSSKLPFEKDIVRILVRDLYQKGVPRRTTVRSATRVRLPGYIRVRLTPARNSVLGTYILVDAGGEREVGSIKIELERTALHHGERIWFLCPRCGERVGILYLIPWVIACRKCSALRYQSQIDPSEPARTRARAIRARLGPPLRPGGRPTRPKGQHRATYARLCEQLEQLEDEERARTGQSLSPIELLVDELLHRRHERRLAAPDQQVGAAGSDELSLE